MRKVLRNLIKKRKWIKEARCKPGLESGTVM